MTAVCPNCRGFGVVMDGKGQERRCPKCNGSGTK